jgi:hypothetical protein
MRDRPGDQRYLMAARRVLVDWAGLEHDRAGSTAFWAENPAASARRTAPSRTDLQCHTATDPKGCAAYRRFAQSLLELHNVLGHPNVPQSLSSTKLHHPLRTLKFVGNQETFLNASSRTSSRTSSRKYISYPVFDLTAYAVTCAILSLRS